MICLFLYDLTPHSKRIASLFLSLIGQAEVTLFKLLSSFIFHVFKPCVVLDLGIFEVVFHCSGSMLYLSHMVIEVLLPSLEHQLLHLEVLKVLLSLLLLDSLVNLLLLLNLLFNYFEILFLFDGQCILLSEMPLESNLLACSEMSYGLLLGSHLLQLLLLLLFC